MKKFFAFILTISLLGFASVKAQAESNTKDIILQKLALYVPNVFLDALDTFSVTLGAGLNTEARLIGTRYLDFGLGVNASSARAMKAYNRQYGFAIDEGWYWSFAVLGDEEFTVRDSTSLVDKIVVTRGGLPEIGDRNYNIRTGARDMWAIGGALGLVVDGELYIHPIDIADFFTGLFLYDLKGDDLTFDDFR